MGALWDTKEHHFNQGYNISQCIMHYIVGEYGHKVEEIYNVPSTDRWDVRSSQREFGVASEGIPLEAPEDMR